MLDRRPVPEMPAKGMPVDPSASVPGNVAFGG
jgi:hypothetical protein